GGLGGIAGFVIGGPLIDGPGWGWIFFINIPVGVVVSAAVLRMMEPDGAPAGGRAFDVGGAITVTGALAALIYGISEVPRAGWGDARVLVSLAAFAVLAVAFVVIETRVSRPLVPLRLFANPLLSGGNLLLLLMGMIVNGTWFVLTLYVQGMLNYSATGFGLLMLAPAAGSIVGAQLGQRLASRFSPGALTAAGTGATAVAVVLLLRVSPDAGLLSVALAPVLIIGLAFGVGMVAASIAALTGVPAADSGAASGVKESAYMIGAPIGVALLSSVAVWGSDTALDGGAAAAAAEINGYRMAFITAAVLAAVVVTVALTMMRRRQSTPKPETVEDGVAAV
ncbi:MAG: MFS transporter, partial [Stackebrandtia sp.]